MVGMYFNPCDVRFTVVDGRKDDTLIPLIDDYKQKGSTVVTDGWVGYCRLCSAGSIMKSSVTNGILLIWKPDFKPMLLRTLGKKVVQQ